jgi:hypothetical protein
MANTVRPPPVSPPTVSEAPANEAATPPMGARVVSPETPQSLPYRSATNWSKIIAITAIVIFIAGFLTFVELLHFGI